MLALPAVASGTNRMSLGAAITLEKVLFSVFHTRIGHETGSILPFPSKLKLVSTHFYSDPAGENLPEPTSG